MANTFLKLPLSASINGKRILIAATGSASATPLHTAVAGTSAIDEVWLYAYNDATSSLTLNILWGGIVEPDDVNRVTIASRTGRTLVVDGQILQNELTISAYAQMGNMINIDGFINRITP